MSRILDGNPVPLTTATFTILPGNDGCITSVITRQDSATDSTGSATVDIKGTGDGDDVIQVVLGSGGSATISYETLQNNP